MVNEEKINYYSDINTTIDDLLADRDVKYCSKCKKFKRTNSFGENKSRKDGLHNWCKECDNKHQKGYLEKNPYATRKTSLKKYKLSIEDELILYNFQCHRCYVCGHKIELHTKNCHVDHCPTTNLLRGLACFNCNTKFLSAHVLILLALFKCTPTIMLFTPAQELWPGRNICEVYSQLLK